MSFTSAGKAAFTAALLVTAMWQAGHAATLEVELRAAGGEPVEDAVVYLRSGKTRGLPLRAADARIDQIDKTFVPLVSVVQTGTRITFPNKDNIRHHVYSFSKAKRFEIKLYADTPAKPVLFDKPGYVVMGCNIHDTMIAHLLVVDTPWFAKSDRQGRASLRDVPPGDYSLIVWYYMRPDKDALASRVSLRGDEKRTLVVKTRASE
ncbi:MAG: methylamine utilization protein [Pseudomonadota bacterium]